jgi:glutamyl-Q tRNA(Asp) synthetase
MAFVTRFAPSPTGPLHLGHAFSALLAHDMARKMGGQFLLRIEDIDRQRSKPAWEQQLKDDLAWLGVHWDSEPLRQASRQPAYDAALDRLWQQRLLYPCTCTRRDVEAALSAPQEGAEHAHGPDGLIYPGTCREKMQVERISIIGPARPRDATLRLDLAQIPLGVFEQRKSNAGADLRSFAAYLETGIGPAGATGQIEFTPKDMVTQVGDFVVSRRDMGTSYHLSVVIDDAAQGVTHVVRGADLTDATRIHVTLQRLLGLPTPIYHHHRLIRDENGKRLAKRDDAKALSKYRAEGATPADIRTLVGL